MQKIEAMRIAGKINRQAINAGFEIAQPGTTLLEIDKFLLNFVLSKGMTPSFRGHGGYPANACISVNDTIVHGMPNDYCLKNGDLLTIDFGTKYNDWCTDAATTKVVGEYKNEEDRLLVNGSLKVLEACQDSIIHGVSLWEIADVTEKAASRLNLTLFSDFNGHAIGKSLHEEPMIYHTKSNKESLMRESILTEGMTICVEPAVTFGNAEYFIADDNWTIKSLDETRSSHQEVMLLVTKTGNEVLS